VWAAAEGAVLRVRVRPGASHTGVAGLIDDALRVRVAAAPVRGAANQALLGLLAALLRVRRGDLEIQAGSHGREKQVRVRGLAPGEVRARLAAALSVDTPAGHN
jgi:uncharacterized protein (TIGR00251 family)